MYSEYKFRSNSDLCLTDDLRQMLPGVIAYGVQFDLNLYNQCTINSRTGAWLFQKATLLSHPAYRPLHC